MYRLAFAVLGLGCLQVPVESRAVLLPSSPQADVIDGQYIVVMRSGEDREVVEQIAGRYQSFGTWGIEGFTG